MISLPARRTTGVPESDIGSAAQHRGKEGILTSGSDEYLMYHEISHYWVNTDLFTDRWLLEGFAELNAYIVGYRVRGRTSAKRFRARKLAHILAYPKPDFPLQEWTFGQESTLERERFAYGKAFVACSLLMDRFGLHRLQRVNRLIRRRKRPVDTRQYIGWREQVLDRSGKSSRPDVGLSLSGWVLAGPYRLEGRRVTLKEYLGYLRNHPPKVPARLDPTRPDAVHPPTTGTRPADTRPSGRFLDHTVP